MGRWTTRLTAWLLALTVLFSGLAWAEEDIPADESDDYEAALQNEPKVTVSQKELAVTPGLAPDWTNILLAGSDSRGGNSYSRTDAMIILSINTKTAEIKMTSVMRDIWTPMHGRSPQKINACTVFGGPTLAMRTLNEDFALNIEDYVLIDMQAIEEVIDIIGGVEIEITEKEYYALRSSNNATDTALITPPDSWGLVTLTGEQALAYARLRAIDNDYERTARQRRVLMAIARQAGSLSLGDLTTLIVRCLDYVETDIDLVQLINLARVGIGADLDAVQEFRLPVEGTYTSGVMPENKLWVIQPDFEANAQALHEFIYGPK